MPDPLYKKTTNELRKFIHGEVTLKVVKYDQYYEIKYTT